MHNDGIDPETKRKIIGVLNVLFPGVKIYLFGSRATGKFHERSDIDLAIDAGKIVLIDDAREALNAVAAPNKVDLVDMHLAFGEFRDEILKHGVEFKL